MKADEASKTAESFRHMCIINILDGLRDGLSHFSTQSRAAVIYAIEATDPICIYDPQNLLRGHEPRLKELYLDSNAWRDHPSPAATLGTVGPIYFEKNLQLAGLISFGARSGSIFYQMWFTEQHPDMCSIGPTERWLEHAAWLLSQDVAAQNFFCMGTSGYVLREYATHAVRDHIVDERNIMMGWDTQIRVFPVLDAVLGISKTREEGAWTRGKLAVVEPSLLSGIGFITEFPEAERPLLRNHKHVRKMLLAVEFSERLLVSDGMHVVGIAAGQLPAHGIIADFRGAHGFLWLNGLPVCSFFDGRFHSSTRQAKLVQVEEALLEPHFDPSTTSELFKIVAKIVHNAEDQKFGCTLVLDLNQTPIEIAGQHLKSPIDLTQEPNLDLARSLAKIDGALHIGIDLKLQAFACLLDGCSIPGEDRARGARFNSALRFTAQHQNLIVVVVSSDRPVSVIQEGVELSAQCEWKPVPGFIVGPPLLSDWLNEDVN
jgi:hypothetical protein